jgi:hypothetical protein
VAHRHLLAGRKTRTFSLLAPELAPHYSGRVAPTFGVFFSLQAAMHDM